MTQPAVVNERPQRIVATALLGTALFWVFWPTLEAMARRWGTDPRYSHGYLVPLFACYLLWSRRGRASGPARCRWWGLAILVAGLAARAGGTLINFEWLAGVALLPSLAGVALLAGGRPALVAAWPAVAFLFFMVPLPYQFETALAGPLQRFAALSSTYALQTLGFAAIAEGNTIRMGTIRLGVVEACSGLSMMLIFFALSTAVAIVVRRPWYERAAFVVSAVPIAVAANVIRITVAGVLHKLVGGETAELVYHDLAGWLMMPLALLMLWAEMKLLGWVIVDRVRRNFTPSVLTGMGKVGPPARAAKTAPHSSPAGASAAPAAGA
jgi:exosortase